MSNPQIIRAYVVDVQTSTIVCSMVNHQPACLEFAKDILLILKDHHYAHIYFDKVASLVTKPHKTNHNTPNIVIALDALVQLGLIKKNQTHCQYNQQDYLLIDYRNLIAHLDTFQAQITSHALQLMRWRADHRFCSRCGTPTHSHAHEYASVCPKCHYRSYPRVQPCVITAIIRHTNNQPELLLALHHRHLQKDNPQKSMYGLIAGFVEIGESLESAVMRETKEETGLVVNHIRYIGSQPWPYPSNVMVGFVAEYAGGTLTPQADELYDAKFFALDNLPVIPKTGTIARTLIDWVIADLTK